MSFEIGTRVLKDFGGNYIMNFAKNDSTVYAVTKKEGREIDNFAISHRDKIRRKNHIERLGGREQKGSRANVHAYLVIIESILSLHWLIVLQTLFHITYDDGDEEDVYIEEIRNLVVEVC